MFYDQQELPGMVPYNLIRYIRIFIFLYIVFIVYMEVKGFETTDI